MEDEEEVEKWRERQDTLNGPNAPSQHPSGYARTTLSGVWSRMLILFFEKHNSYSKSARMAPYR